MAEQDIDLQARFSPVPRERWRDAVDKDLRGKPFERLKSRTRDGIEVEPLYTREDLEALGPLEQVPALPRFVRGRTALGAVGCGWDVRQEIAEPGVREAREAIAHDRRHGATGVFLRLDATLRTGSELLADESPVGSPGLVLAGHDDLRRVLEEVELPDVSVSLDAGVATLALAGALVEVARERDVEPGRLRGALGFDPLGQLAATGRLDFELDACWRQMADLAAWCAAHAPGLVPVTVATDAYVAGGASAAHELACALATGVEYVRRLVQQGLPLATACRGMTFRLGVGRDLFVEIAKLRAARRLWARVVELAGGDEESQALRLWVLSSSATLSARDPWVNMLRVTVGTFGAAVAGAEAITAAPFDEHLGVPDRLGRRLAAHTQVILHDESHLGRVIDAAGGSWYVETLTERLCERAWAGLQQIEEQGGMAAALVAGKVQKDVAAAARELRTAVHRRKMPVTGVSSYPQLDERPVVRTPRDAAPARTAAASRPASGAGDTALRQLEHVAAAPDPAAGALTDTAGRAFVAGASPAAIAAALGRRTGAVTAPAVESLRLAEDFETLRAASDRAAAGGLRPRAFLANIGPIPRHRARADFAANFFAAGGIEPLTNDGFADPAAAAEAFAASGAPIACLCGHDEDYPDVVPRLAPLLREAGARAILLAGRPGEHEEAWRKVGVDRFIHVGSDVHGVLHDLLAELEVIR
jgi:methylmalonyl-CoA mutase